VCAEERREQLRVGVAAALQCAVADLVFCTPRPRTSHGAPTVALFGREDPVRSLSEVGAIRVHPDGGHDLVSRQWSTRSGVTLDAVDVAYSCAEVLDRR
jgi:hypothetical protein